MYLKDFIIKINSVMNNLNFEKYFDWFIQKFYLTDKSIQFQKNYMILTKK